MDWDKLRIFHAAAEAGSFTHAGDALHMNELGRVAAGVGAGEGSESHACSTDMPGASCRPSRARCCSALSRR